MAIPKMKNTQRMFMWVNSDKFRSQHAEIELPMIYPRENIQWKEK